MTKARNTLLIFSLLVIQSVLALFVGISALYHYTRDTLPTKVFVGEDRIPIGGKNYDDAAAAIEEDYRVKFEKEVLLLDVEDSGVYEISLAGINARVDGYATLRPFKTPQGIKGITEFLYHHFGRGRPLLNPAIKIDESRLRQILLEISEDVFTGSVDASIDFVNGVIEKKAETAGTSLNVANTAATIKERLLSGSLETVKLTRAGDYELQAVIPSVKIKDFDDIQKVFSVYTTMVMDKALVKGIRIAVEAIDKTMLLPLGGTENQEFSFVDLLAAGNTGFENDNEGYDQVASTLHAALLLAGVPPESITRLAHKLMPNYIELGLDVWISSDAGDLKFRNPFTCKAMIFAKLDDQRVTIAIAGNLNDKKQDYAISTKVVQTIAPPVYSIENPHLLPGEEVLINPGKEGKVVELYLNDTLIGTDTYDAEKRIIQIGPVADQPEESK